MVREGDKKASGAHSTRGLAEDQARSIAHKYGSEVHAYDRRDIVRGHDSYAMVTAPTHEEGLGEEIGSVLVFRPGTGPYDTGTV